MYVYKYVQSFFSGHHHQLVLGVSIFGNIYSFFRHQLWILRNSRACVGKILSSHRVPSQVLRLKFLTGHDGFLRRPLWSSIVETESTMPGTSQSNNNFCDNLLTTQITKKSFNGIFSRDHQPPPPRSNLFDISQVQSLFNPWEIEIMWKCSVYQKRNCRICRLPDRIK